MRRRRTRSLLVSAAGVLTAAVALQGIAAAASGVIHDVSGGAPVGGLAPTHKHTTSPLTPPGQHSHGRWLSGVTITEYWPAPESWFVGRLVRVPGLRDRHRNDWLYSARGVSMEGDGLGLDGHMYHLDQPGYGGWVTASGAATSPSLCSEMQPRQSALQAGDAGSAPSYRRKKVFCAV